MQWFKVDSNTPTDPKIRAVIREMGPTGLGGLLCIWCHVARHGRYPGQAINSQHQWLSVEEIQEASMLSDAQFRTLVDICIQTGHFKREAWEQFRGIWIPAMERRGDYYTQKYLRHERAATMSQK